MKRSNIEVERRFGGRCNGSGTKTWVGSREGANELNREERRPDQFNKLFDSKVQGNYVQNQHARDLSRAARIAGARTLGKLDEREERENKRQG